MIETFSIELFEVIEGAREVARTSGNREIGSAHLLAAILDAQGCGATAALFELGIDTANAREALEPLLFGGGQAVASPQLSEQAQDLIHTASRSVHGYVGTAQLLLAILSRWDLPIPAANTLVEFGITATHFYDKVGKNARDAAPDGPQERRAVHERSEWGTIFVPPGNDLHAYDRTVRFRAVEVRRTGVAVMYTERDDPVAGEDSPDALPRYKFVVPISVIDDVGTEFNPDQMHREFPGSKFVDSWWFATFYNVPPESARVLRLSWADQIVSLPLDHPEDAD